MGEVGGKGQGQISAPAPLAAEHDLTDFDCGVPVLDEWLQRRAMPNESRFSRTYAARTGTRVVGYYCISAGAIERGSAPNRLRRNAPDSIPISVIGRLAVDKRFGGRGLGAALLADALKRVAIASQAIGIGAVMIQAKDDSAKRFYLRQAEFLEYPTDSRTLYLPIDTVVAAFS